MLCYLISAETGWKLKNPEISRDSFYLIILALSISLKYLTVSAFNSLAASSSQTIQGMLMHLQDADRPHVVYAAFNCMVNCPGFIGSGSKNHHFFGVHNGSDTDS